MKLPEMRSREEIQHAHDMLTGILLGDMPFPVGDEAKNIIKAWCDALCWALNHSCNDVVEEGLSLIEQYAERTGYVLELKGD